MKKNLKKDHLSRGFTLIELLAVIIVLIVISSIIVGVFMTTLRSVNKSNSLSAIRENGNYAITQISKMIRYSSKFDGVSQDGITYINNCTSGVIQNTKYAYLKVTDYDNYSTTFTCSTGLGGNIASTSGSLSDNLLDSSIINSVDVCSFSCYQANPNDLPVITFNLTISQKGSIGIIERNTTVPFQTSIIFRNGNTAR